MLNAKRLQQCESYRQGYMYPTLLTTCNIMPTSSVCSPSSSTLVVIYVTTERRFQRLEANLKHHNYSRVAISSIIHRRSTERVSRKIKNLKIVLQSMCTRNNWIYIENDFIDESCIEGDGVQLNGRGGEMSEYSIRFRLSISVECQMETYV
jgi:hypothetical protein